MYDRKSLLDLIVVQEEKRNKHLDVNVFKGAEWGISKHYLLASKIIFLKSWHGRMVRMKERYKIKLSKVTYKTKYEEMLKQRCKRVRER